MPCKRSPLASLQPPIEIVIKNPASVGQRREIVTRSDAEHLPGDWECGERLMLGRINVEHPLLDHARFIIECNPDLAPVQWRCKRLRQHPVIAGAIERKL